jgi:predicted small lipoprotein YifL
MKRLASLVLVALSALTVAACGLRGDLERPPPLWGDPPADGGEEMHGGEDDTDDGADD